MSPATDEIANEDGRTLPEAIEDVESSLLMLAATLMHIRQSLRIGDPSIVVPAAVVRITQAQNMYRDVNLDHLVKLVGALWDQHVASEPLTAEATED